MMLSAAQIAAMQATAQMVLDKTAGITRPNTGTDTWGSPNSGSPTTVAASVACALTKPSPQMLAQYADKVIGRVAYTVLLPVGTATKAGDLITVGTHSLKVEAVSNLESYAMLLSVLAVEVS